MFTTVIPLPQPLNENGIAYCGVSGVLFIDLAGYSSGVSSINLALQYFVSNLGVRRYTICILADATTADPVNMAMGCIVISIL